MNILRKIYKCIHNLRQHRQCTYNVTLRRVRVTIVAVVFVALGNQHAMRMRRIILSSVACPALQYFYNYFIKSKIFEKKLFNINVCFDFLYKLFLSHFSF